MTIQIGKGVVVIPTHPPGTSGDQDDNVTRFGPHTEQVTIPFNGPVRTANAIISGVEFGYDEDDHPLGEVEYSIDQVQATGRNVTVSVKLGLRNGNTRHSHRYRGQIQVSVIADVE